MWIVKVFLLNSINMRLQLSRVEGFYTRLLVSYTSILRLQVHRWASILYIDRHLVDTIKVFELSTFHHMFFTKYFLLFILFCRNRHATHILYLHILFYFFFEGFSGSVPHYHHWRSHGTSTTFVVLSPVSFLTSKFCLLDIVALLVYRQSTTRSS